MVRETIEFTVIRAMDLTPFTLNGKRHMHYHYFKKTDEGWLYCWIDENTDIEWLKAQIAEGVIYVFED